MTTTPCSRDDKIDQLCENLKSYLRKHKTPELEDKFYCFCKGDGKLLSDIDSLIMRIQESCFVYKYDVSELILNLMLLYISMGWEDFENGNVNVDE
jgi:hypothetical protein